MNPGETQDFDYSYPPEGTLEVSSEMKQKLVC